MNLVRMEDYMQTAERKREEDEEKENE